MYTREVLKRYRAIWASTNYISFAHTRAKYWRCFSNFVSIISNSIVVHTCTWNIEGRTDHYRNRFLCVVRMHMRSIEVISSATGKRHLIRLFMHIYEALKGRRSQKGIREEKIICVYERIVLKSSLRQRQNEIIELFVFKVLKSRRKMLNIWENRVVCVHTRNIEESEWKVRKFWQSLVRMHMRSIEGRYIASHGLRRSKSFTHVREVLKGHRIYSQCDYRRSFARVREALKVT